MMAASVILLFAAVTTSRAEGCEEVEPQTSPDPELSKVYQSIGERELEAGGMETARAAFREALRLDPNNASARNDLELLCSPRTEAELDRATRWMDEGRYGEALEILWALEAKSSVLDPNLAYLIGICHFERGEVRDATGYLERARRAEPLRERAELLLGLIALRTHRGDEAMASFRRSGEVGRQTSDRSAEILERTLARSGQLVLGATLELGFDSNVELYSSEASPDGIFLAELSALYRPEALDDIPYVRADAQLNQYLAADAYDLFAAGAAGGASYRISQLQLAAEYGARYVALDWNGYIFEHGPLVAAAYAPRGYRVTLAYALGLDHALSSLAEASSGPRHQATAGCTFFVGYDLALGARYVLTRVRTGDASLRYYEHTVALNGTLAITDTVGLDLEASLAPRNYDSAVAGTQAVRGEQALELALGAEIELHRWLSLVPAVHVRKVWSNIPEFSHIKVFGGLGLRVLAGML